MGPKLSNSRIEAFVKVSKEQPWSGYVAPA